MNKIALLSPLNLLNGGKIMKNEYVYPAIFSYDEDGISIEFPDIPGCLPCADTTEEAIKNAKEALGLHLYGMEEENEPIPEPTDIKEIKIENNTAIVLIDVYMPTIRERIKNKYIKKTLTIKSWLNVEGEKRRVNFSGLLNDALENYIAANPTP